MKKWLNFKKDWFKSNDTDINVIREALPSLPNAFGDRVIEQAEDTIVAIKNVTINEPFF